MVTRSELLDALRVLRARRAGLSDEVVDQVLASLHRRLRAEHGPVGERSRRYVSILFAHLEGFQTTREGLDPEDVVERLNRIWSRLDLVAISHGGRIDKHIGAGVMVLFGADQAEEDDPVRAVQCGLAMQRALASLEPELGLRVGVNSGTVLLGLVGTTGEYTAMGDAVNLASRLEKAAPTGGVLISPETWRHTRGLFEGEVQTPMLFKGKAEPLAPVVVTGRKASDTWRGRRGVEGVTTPLLGRRAELTELMEDLDRCFGEHRPGGWRLEGGAGVGKTRLVEAFVAEARKRYPDALVVRFAGRPEDRLAPFSLFQRATAAGLGLPATRDAATFDALGKTLVDLIGEDVRPALPHVARVLGYPLAEGKSTADTETGAESLGRALVIFRRMVEVVASRRRQVLIIDDLHFSDEAAVRALDDVLHQLSPVPLFVLVLTRPRLGEASDGPRLPTALSPHTLAPLGPDDLTTLARFLLAGAGPAPMDLPDRLVALADGNPYHLEELVQMLLDQGRLDPLHGADLEWVPATLTAVLEGRLDVLAPTARHLLEQAAVVGRTFWLESLEALGDQDPLDGLAPAALLADLEAGGFVHRQPESTIPGTAEYTFNQSALREVARARVLLAQRREWCRRCARWLESRVEDPEQWAAHLADWFEVAGDNDDAARWHKAAGDRDRDAHAVAKSVDHYQRAVALADATVLGNEGYQWALEGIARGLGHLGHYEEAITAGLELKAAAEAAGDLPGVIHALGITTGFARSTGGLERTEAFTEEALALARGLDDPELISFALVQRFWVEYRAGRVVEARTCAEEAATSAEASGVPLRRAWALQALGAILSDSGDFDGSRRADEGALEIFREFGVSRGVAGTLNNIAENLRQRGASAEAIPLYEEAGRIYAAIGHVPAVYTLRCNRAGALIELGDLAPAVEALEGVLATMEDDWWQGAEAWALLSTARLGIGRVEDAVEAACRGVTIALAATVTDQLGNAWRALGNALSVRGGTVEMPEIDPAPFDAETCFVLSAHVLEDIEAWPGLARTLLAHADHRRRAGDAAGADELEARGRALAEKVGLVLGPTAQAS